MITNKEKNMNNKMKLLVVGISTFVVGLSVNNFAMSDVPSKIAVVDVQKVVTSSSQVKALKKEQEAKAGEIVKFVENARKDVAAQSDVNKKKALEAKYNKELVAKKGAMDKTYATKLKAIDDSISQVIAAKAKASGYDIVLSKGVVLYGGSDITADIMKVVK